MSGTRFVLRFVGLWCLLAVAVQAAPQSPGTSLDPARTHALVIGVLEWKEPETWSSFESTHRRDALLVEHLRQRGLPASRLTYLKDSQATLAAIRAALARVLAGTRAGDTLLVYYCGHGFLEAGEGYFANHDCGDARKTWWPIKELVDTVEARFAGERALLFADCCHSGRLVDEVQHRSPTRIAYGVFTSSSAEETSTGNWTFTQALYDALTGNPLVDRDRNGRITATELAQHAADEMTVFEGQRNAWGMTGGFDPATVLSTAPTGAVPARFGERIRVFADGDWWSGRILEVKGDRARIRWVTIGYDTAESDEWHPLAKLKPLKLVQYPVGKSVMVKWKRKWYPATVREVRGGQHLIHYAGHDKEWDEWVPPGRIRVHRREAK